ncbi:MAG TPA: hypothetical protein VEG34_13365 [Thermoanaerobaculia bacterium]|nr:hypothetical protein [Thermoanaerobaculia bacterium]
MRPGPAAFAACLLLALLAPAAARPDTAPDPTAFGPHATTSSEYKLPAAIDPEVAPEIATELWARVYRPADLAAAPHPLLVFLHGNHGTCGRLKENGRRVDNGTQYTFAGTCPPTQVVVPNHEGFAYLAERLASWGYVVVSINTNRGVNGAPALDGDFGLNLRRGRLVLRHLQRLAEWNAAGGAPASLGFDLQNQLDFQSVGLLGHSRGGEGLRAAYNLYRDPASPWPARLGPVRFQALFEIAPVDGQTGRELNADGTAWNVLLPMCDGDVSDLKGVRVFDRALRLREEEPAAPKSTLTVWGANHNYFNSEWQRSDSKGCLGHRRLFRNQLGGSAEQRATALFGALAFFRGHVGPNADPELARLLDPLYEVPASLAEVTRVDRGYTPSADAAVTTVFDDFDGESAAASASGVTVTYGPVLRHSPVQRAAAVTWTQAGQGTWFQSNWAGPGAGLDASGFQTLDFRVSRQCIDEFCHQPDPQAGTVTSFSIQLVGRDGRLSRPVRLADYFTLTGPVGALIRGFGPAGHPILQTVRIPLASFGRPSIVSDLRGVRFTFDDTPADEIFLANIRLSNAEATAALPAGAPGAAEDDSAESEPAIPDDNQVASIRAITGHGAGGTGQRVEIELRSNREFLPQGELLVLAVGDRRFARSRYREDGDTRTVIFTLTPEEFAALRDQDPLGVQYGSSAGGGWSFGRLEKSRLTR